jgi:hypothetical protein
MIYAFTICAGNADFTVLILRAFDAHQDNHIRGRKNDVNLLAR